jgi:hypothetical protein
VAPEPLRYRFGVGCPVERALELWTTGAGLWWPMARRVELLRQATTSGRC